MINVAVFMEVSATDIMLRIYNFTFTVAWPAA